MFVVGDQGPMLVRMAMKPGQLTLRVQNPFADAGLPDAPRACMVVLVGHALGQSFPIDKRMELGRSPACPIEILDEGVSRQHAAVVQQADGTYVLQDMGSRNGTFLNGMRIENARLTYGDKVAFGTQTVLLFARTDHFEDQRLQAQKLQALGQLAGGIAHDFNNLLGVVLANISHLRDVRTSDPAEIDGTLADIETAARRAVDLTRQLLSFARSERRRHEPIAVDTLVKDVARLLRRTVHRSIDIQTESETGLVIIGDSSQMLQVLMNLCINGADAMKGGGTLRIAAKRRVLFSELRTGIDAVSAGEYVAICVTDTGVGMGPGLVDHVFDPFFTTKPRGQGTGLGLATASAIVREHGGMIRVESAVDVGSTFEVLVPAARAYREKNADTVPQVVRELSGTVLLADDDELVRMSTKRLLRHCGLDVIEAGDGEEALALLQGAVVDLVMLDLDMPKMDGEQAVRHMRELGIHVPILVASGYIDDERLEVLRQLGVQHILYKPFDADALRLALAEALA